LVPQGKTTTKYEEVMFETIEDVLKMLNEKCNNKTMDDNDAMIYLSYSSLVDTMNYILDKGEAQGEIKPWHIQTARNLMDNFLLNAYNIGLLEACEALRDSLETGANGAFYLPGLRAETNKWAENADINQVIQEEIHRQGLNWTLTSDPVDFVN
jgi:ABC-type xylose transport system substrate-binding protein